MCTNGDRVGARKGGREANKHEHKKLRRGRGAVGKATVVGLRERGGRTITERVDTTDANTLQGAIYRHIEVGSTVHTDDAAAYAGLGSLFYGHESG